MYAYMIMSGEHQVQFQPSEIENSLVFVNRPEQDIVLCYVYV